MGVQRQSKHEYMARMQGRYLAPPTAPAQRAADLREAAAHARRWWHRGWWDEEDAGVEAVATRLDARRGAASG
jgi:hypothetical protein